MHIMILGTVCGGLCRLTCEDMSRWNGPSLGLDSTVRIFCFIIWRWGTIQSTPLVMVPMTEQVQTFSPTPRRPGLALGGRPEMLSYLLGVVCHFTLDAACHGYVEKKIQKSGASHIQIEMEFDRYLMCADGLDPLRHRLTRHICPTNDRAAMIAPVYPPLKPEEVLHALLAMKFYDFLLTGQSRWKRGLVDVGMRLTGNYESMRYMKIGRTPAAICADSNLRLNKLMNRAIPEARRAIEDFLAYCLNGKALPPFFDRTFGAGEGWSQIPVLPYEEEIYYEV